MNTPTRRFLKKAFWGYYRHNAIQLPPRFGRREWAFVFWDKDFMKRHTAFRKQQELENYLLGGIPRHLYHSSSYYRDPANRSMKDKDWLGADLVFDLDADHLRDVEGLNFPQLLARVKEEFWKLLDFLTEDFGIPEDQQLLVFSGGRGYHLHVHDPRALGLGSDERREIVDYITGKGLDPELFIKEVPYKRTERGPYPDKIDRIRVLRKDYGWQKRVFEGILELVSVAESKGDMKARVKYLSSHKGLGKKRAQTVATRLFTGEEGSRGVDLLREGKIDFFNDKQTLTSFLKVGFNFALEHGRGETDEPVTGDIHRLIRTPGSLHGKSGLRVTPFKTREELDDFEPLVDAVVFSNEPTQVLAKRTASLFMKGEEYRITQGEMIELPEAAAIFSLGVGLTEIPDPVPDSGLAKAPGSSTSTE